MSFKSLTLKNIKKPNCLNNYEWWKSGPAEHVMRSECAGFQINNIQMYVTSPIYLLWGQIIFSILNDWAYVSCTLKILTTCLNAKKQFFLDFYLLIQFREPDSDWSKFESVYQIKYSRKTSTIWKIDIQKTCWNRFKLYLRIKKIFIW